MRSVETSQFPMHDGVALFYRHWPAPNGSAKGAIVLFHRGHEHSGRLSHLADELGMPDYDIFAWDARGHGESPGERGDAPSFGALVRDVQSFIDHIGRAHAIPLSDIAVVAQSVGAVVVTAWVHDYAPKIRALVVASPAFKVKLYMPFARPGLRLWQAYKGNFFVQSYVKSTFLTHDSERQRSFDADKLITRAISVRILLGLDEAAKRVVADARAIVVPTQLIISGADWVVHHGPQHRFYENLGSHTKERHVLPGFYHDTLGEKDRAIAIGHIKRFLAERFAAPLEQPTLLDADRQGATRDEADKLASPLPLASPKGLYWAGTRLGLLGAGLVSDGIKVGHKTGFDSGSTLDYVYRNTPSGRSKLGQMVDRNYLGAIGWRGIRQRKVHIEELLRIGMNRLREAGLPVNIVDIAAGHGRYVLEAIEADGVIKPDSILLRDYSDINVEAGRRLISEKGLGDVAHFVKGDAFDAASLAAIEPTPNLGLVSGLYELFADNSLVKWSLGGLAAAIQPGGYLIYTGQPWHPQLEFIARALTSHRQGQAWVMRRRSQAEMDQLVEAAGFEKLEQRIDEWGIFTVSIARRKAAT